jgi:hypothetical protein
MNYFIYKYKIINLLKDIHSMINYCYLLFILLIDYHVLLLVQSKGLILIISLHSLLRQTILLKCTLPKGLFKQGRYSICE